MRPEESDKLQGEDFDTSGCGLVTSCIDHGLIIHCKMIRLIQEDYKLEVKCYNLYVTRSKFNQPIPHCQIHLPVIGV